MWDSIFNLLFWAVTLLAVSSGLIAAGSYAYFYFSDKLRNVRQDLLQSEMDKMLNQSEGKIGHNLRARVLVFNQDVLRAELIRPQKTESSAREADGGVMDRLIEDVARVVQQRRSVWYASELPQETSTAETDSAQQPVRGIVAVPLKNTKNEIVGVISLESSSPFSVDKNQLEQTLKPIAQLGSTLF